MAKLGTVCDILNGYAFKSEKYVNSGIRVIRITNVQKGFIEDNDPKYYPLDESKNIEKYFLKSGDLLLSLTGNVGRVGIINDRFLPAALNQRVACLRIKNDNIFEKFLFHLLNSDYFEEQCILASNGVAQKNLSTEWLKEFEIPLPPLEIQKQIADNLDKVTRTIDICNTILEKLDLLVKSRFVEMFGDPIDNPMGWQVKSLKELSTLITNGNTPKGGSENYVDNGIIFLRSQNVWRNRIDLSDVAYIDENTHLKMKKSIVMHKDILITKTGRINTENSSLGRAALYLGEDNSANINGHVYLVRLKDFVIPEFVVTILTGEAYRKYIRKVCVGGIDKRQINLDQVEDFPIIMPNMERQQVFADFLKQTDKSKLAVKKVLEKAETLKNALMQEYFG